MRHRNYVPRHPGLIQKERRAHWKARVANSPHPPARPMSPIRWRRNPRMMLLPRRRP